MWLKLRHNLDKQVFSFLPLITKIANRLQRKLLAQQNRNWDFNMEDGYLDTSRLSRIIANPQAKANNGKLALRRGPLVYCLEATDNDGSVRDIALPRNSPLKAKFEPNLLDGVVVLQGPANRRIAADWGTELYKTVSFDQETQITAIPYFAWDNRESGQMTVWLPESTILTEP